MTKVEGKIDFNQFKQAYYLFTNGVKLKQTELYQN